jgi:hypothetical protein
VVFVTSTVTFRLEAVFVVSVGNCNNSPLKDIHLLEFVALMLRSVHSDATEGDPFANGAHCVLNAMGEHHSR